MIAVCHGLRDRRPQVTVDDTTLGRVVLGLDGFVLVGVELVGGEVGLQVETAPAHGLPRLWRGRHGARPAHDPGARSACGRASRATAMHPIRGKL